MWAGTSALTETLNVQYSAVQIAKHMCGVNSALFICVIFLMEDLDCNDSLESQRERFRKTPRQDKNNSVVGAWGKDFDPFQAQSMLMFSFMPIINQKVVHTHGFVPVMFDTNIIAQMW